ncbi:DUF397 domain-containing protein [Amycolatopsis antarctica]|uniref:DUF397 domain-containing protein n=1 Tax=Amycolatopsis antarctica TaxID=1854586 RepID=A0A263D315_9PSEU|nr:DUF397 domain-containing protein [Amycolatopsis antarctica]OZM72599.1 DUF397 domain-containing protein [Amycolatopsis antarctica]
MTAPDFTGSTWIKSSYSGGNGGSCVEIAFTGWRKSSHSGGNGGECVEVGHAEDAAYVGVRDTKDRSGGHLAVPAPAWRAFLRAVR